MVFVQHTLTRLYLRSFAEWTAELYDAWLFKDMSEALAYCRLRGLQDVEIIVVGHETVQQFAVAAEDHPSRPRWESIPVVLPETDLQAN